MKQALWLKAILVSAGLMAGDNAPPPQSAWPDSVKVRLSRDSGCMGGEEFQAMVASTPAERARGLSRRSQPLAPDEAMLFVFDGPVLDNFWMKDTLIPLTLLFFDQEGKLVSAREMPVEVDPSRPRHEYGASRPYTMAIELAGGSAARWGGSPTLRLCIEGASAAGAAAGLKDQRAKARAAR